MDMHSWLCADLGSCLLATHLCSWTPWRCIKLLLWPLQDLGLYTRLSASFSPFPHLGLHHWYFLVTLESKRNWKEWNKIDLYVRDMPCSHSRYPQIVTSAHFWSFLQGHFVMILSPSLIALTWQNPGHYTIPLNHGLLFLVFFALPWTKSLTPLHCSTNMCCCYFKSVLFLNALARLWRPPERRLADFTGVCISISWCRYSTRRHSGLLE